MAYEDRCAKGREPPLPSSGGTNEGAGVVIRMAGNESNVTDFSLALLGRRAVFPIFEDGQRPNVKQLLRLYSKPKGGLPTVPIYWQVNNGRYSHADSWDRLRIPQEWIFTTAQGEKLLVLEADATSGQQSSLSLKRTYDSRELDLDLCELLWVGSVKEKKNRQPLLTLYYLCL